MDISVQLDSGLDQNSIEFIQYIEKELDSVLVKNGFARTTTTKNGDLVLFNYSQFGVALSDVCTMQGTDLNMEIQEGCEQARSITPPVYEKRE